MKRIIKCFAIAAVILAAPACMNEAEESPMSFTHELTFTASREGVSPDTKTVRMDDGSTWWNASEEISVSYGSGTGGGSKFTSQNTTLQEIVEFSGSVTMSGSGKDFWAVYPYSQDNEFDGSSITTIIPDVQTGSEGNFSGDVFPAMAKSNSNVFAFWNICGGIKFFVSRSDIKSVTFKGNGGEVLAGKVCVSFNSYGKPEVTRIIDGKSEVTLNAPADGTFKAGKYYYLTLLPASLDGGFTISFNTATERGSVVSNKTQSVKRSVFGVLKNIDSKVSAWETTWVEPKAVDLGLPSGLKWATFNVGASKPEEYGEFFAWGETQPKNTYYWTTYKMCNGSNNTLTKYNTDSLMGNVDHLTVLNLEDDAAFANWGGEWRMPTKDDWAELFEKCTCTWTRDYNGTGIAGTVVSGKKTGFTNNSIFLPAAGNWCDTDILSNGDIGFYWSSSLNSEIPYHAYGVYFYLSYGDINYGDRAYGRPVRPVYGGFISVSSISLDKSTLEMNVDEVSQLTATISPSNATAKDVNWVSSNESVATVDETGLVSAKGAGSATIKAYGSSGVEARCTVMVKDSAPILNGPEYVDLGLSVKWATFNLGASKPEEFGGHFAWGDTETYFEESPSLSENPVWKQGKESGYSFKSYKWCNGDMYSLTKYNCDSSFGAVDYITILYIEDDAAHVIWGDNWRIPTDAEWTELREKCNWRQTNINGAYGYLITSSINGNSIFLPFPDAWEGLKHYTPTSEKGGFYWSSTLYTLYPIGAFGVSFASGKPVRAFTARCHGFSIRPVWSEYVEVQSVSLNKTSLDLYPEESGQLSAIIRPLNATASDVIWVSSDESIATVDKNGNVTGVSAGTATITVYASNGLSAACKVTIKKDLSLPASVEAVDLGLPSGLKWATMNIGASAPEEYGEYFAWGETQPKTEYNWATYKFMLGTTYNEGFSKYVTDSSYGTVDNKTVLDPEDDAASVNWGGSWRMPTEEDWTELCRKCSWKWTSDYNGTGVAGSVVTSKISGYTDKSIFIPAAGGYRINGLTEAGSWVTYWSSSLIDNTRDQVYHFYYISSYDGSSANRGGDSRYAGKPIRPVTR